MLSCRAVRQFRLDARQTTGAGRLQLLALAIQRRSGSIVAIHRRAGLDTELDVDGCPADDHGQLALYLAAQPVHNPVIPESIRQADQELAVFVGDDPGVIHPAIESTTLFDSQFTLQLAPHCMWVKSVAVYHGGFMFTCCGSARCCCDATASTCGVYRQLPGRIAKGLTRHSADARLTSIIWQLQQHKMPP